MHGLLPPEPVPPLVVHGAALSPQQAVGHALAPADVLSCDLAERMTQLSLLDRDDLDRMALGAAMLTYHKADQPLRSSVTLLQEREGPATTFRAQKFPSARSFSIVFSNSVFARGFFRREFSFSS